MNALDPVPAFKQGKWSQMKDILMNETPLQSWTIYRARRFGQINTENWFSDSWGGGWRRRLSEPKAKGRERGRGGPGGCPGCPTVPHILAQGPGGLSGCQEPPDWGQRCWDIPVLGALPLCLVFLSAKAQTPLTSLELGPRGHLCPPVLLPDSVTVTLCAWPTAQLLRVWPADPQHPKALDLSSMCMLARAPRRLICALRFELWPVCQPSSLCGASAVPSAPRGAGKEASGVPDRGDWASRWRIRRLLVW